MNTTLTHWLDEHRATLLPRWIAQLDASSPHNGHANGNGHHLPSQERDLLLGAIYDGLVSAANGDFGPLEECLRLLRALRTSEGENELSERLELTFHLRKVTRDMLFASDVDHVALRLMLEEFEQLIEHATITMASYWTASAAAVTQQLRHTEQLAQSLAEAAEQADRVALQLKNLNELASSLAASLDPASLIATAGGKLAEVLDVAHVSIWLPDGEGLRAAQSWGAPDLAGTQVDLGRPGDVIVRAFREHAAILEPKPAPKAQGGWYQRGCAVLAVPLVAQERVTAVIALQDPDPEANLDRTHQSFAGAVASQSAIALENARLYAEVRGFNTVLEERIAARTRELQTERDMLGTLNQIALEVSSTLDLDLLLQNCLHVLADLIGVEHGSIMLIEKDTGHLVDRAVLGRRPDAVGFTRFPIGQGVAGWVAQYRKPALVLDVNSDDRWVALPKNESGHKQVGSMAAVPLVVQGEVTGVMLLSHDQVGYFNDDHMRLLGASAGEIALGVNNARLYEEILQESLRKGDMLRSERRATTQSAAILQSLSDGVIVCDIDGGILTLNPAAERILDMGVEELLLLRLPELLQRLLGSRSAEMPVEDVLAERSGSRHYATNITSGTRTIQLTLDPVITDKGEVMGAVAVFRDITREVESDRLKDEFIGTVSHELRTPMTSIKGFTQLLAMGSLGPVNSSQKEFLNTIHTNAERMISIINDLLDITKFEAGSVELDVRPLHLAEALGNVVMDLQSTIQVRQHELTITIPPGLPLIKADAKRFDQILSNLMSNAIKYTPHNGKIEVEAFEATVDDLPTEAREGLKPGRYVRIDITDSGIGIAPEEHDLIFNRFYRTENPLKVEAGGTGLGLSLVKPLVKLFNGRIWLRSGVGEGSTFSLVVPAV